MKNVILTILILLIAVPQSYERRIHKKRKLEPVTACIGLAILAGFEILNLHKIYSLRRNIKKLTTEQMKANLEHQKTVQRTIGYCEKAQVAYDQKLNQILKLEKVIIEFKAANSNLSNKTASTSCAMPNRDPNKEIQLKIIEHAKTIQKMRRIYNQDTSKVDLNNKLYEVPDPDALVEDDEHQTKCMISLVENNFKKFKESAIAIAEADLNEMCDVDILKNISDFQKRSSARMNEIRGLESKLKNSSNIIYKLWMSKSYEGMSKELNYVAAQDSQIMHGEKKDEQEKKMKKRVNDWGSVNQGLKILSRRLLRFAGEAVMISFNEEILDATHFVSEKISGLEQAAAIINDFNRGNGVTIARKADLEKEPEMIGSDIGKLMGLKRNNEVAEKVGGFFNHKNIANFVKKSYSGLFEKEVYNSFLPDIWNRNYFKKLEIRKQFMIDFQVLKIGHLAKDFTKTLNQYVKQTQSNSSIRTLLKPEHFNGFNSFTDNLLEYQMLQGNPNVKQSLSPFFYDPISAFGPREVLSLVRRGYEIISVHKSGGQAKEEVKIPDYHMNIGDSNSGPFNLNFADCMVFKDEKSMLIDKSQGHPTSKYFFFMGSRVMPQNKGAKAYVYSKLFTNASFTFKPEELENNFKEVLTSRVKVELEKQMDTFYNRNCQKSDTTIPLVKFIQACELKIKVIYDNFLAYFTIDDQIYTKEFGHFANCFNKYKKKGHNTAEVVDSFGENALLNYKHEQITFHNGNSSANLDLSQKGYYYFDGGKDFSKEETAEIFSFISSIYVNPAKDMNKILGHSTFRFVFEPYKLNFSITDDIYPSKSIKTICDEYNHAENSLVSDLSDVATEDSSADSKKFIRNVKADKGELSHFELVAKGGLFSSFKLNELLHKQLMLSFKSKGEKRYIFIADYLLIKESKVYDFEGEYANGEPKLLHVKIPQPRQIFSTFYSKYDVCRKIQGQIALSAKENSGKKEIMQFFLDNEIDSKDNPLSTFLSNMNRQMQNFSVERSFKISRLFNFEITKEVGYYQASDLSKDSDFDWEPCFYASWAAKVEFKPLPKFKFKVFKSGFDVEVGIEEDKENGLRVSPHVIIVSTLINGKKEAIEDPAKSEIRKYKTIKSTERKYIHCNYKKIDAENGEVSDVKINLKGEMYLLVSFWVKQNDIEFKEVYEENCTSGANASQYGQTAK